MSRWAVCWPGGLLAAEAGADPGVVTEVELVEAR
jgi:hypothetical protein